MRVFAVANLDMSTRYQITWAWNSQVCDDDVVIVNGTTDSSANRPTFDREKREAIEKDEASRRTWKALREGGFDFSRPTCDDIVKLIIKQSHRVLQTRGSERHSAVEDFIAKTKMQSHLELGSKIAANYFPPKERSALSRDEAETRRYFNLVAVFSKIQATERVLAKLERLPGTKVLGRATDAEWERDTGIFIKMPVLPKILYLNTNGVVTHGLGIYGGMGRRATLSRGSLHLEQAFRELETSKYRLLKNLDKAKQLNPAACVDLLLCVLHHAPELDPRERCKVRELIEAAGTGLCVYSSAGGTKETAIVNVNGVCYRNVYCSVDNPSPTLLLDTESKEWKGSQSYSQYSALSHQESTVSSRGPKKTAKETTTSKQCQSTTDETRGRKQTKVSDKQEAVTAVDSVESPSPIASGKHDLTVRHTEQSANILGREAQAPQQTVTDLVKEIGILRDRVVELEVELQGAGDRIVGLETERARERASAQAERGRNQLLTQQLGHARSRLVEFQSLLRADLEVLDAVVASVVDSADHEAALKASWNDQNEFVRQALCPRLAHLVGDVSENEGLAFHEALLCSVLTLVPSSEWAFSYAEAMGPGNPVHVVYAVPTWLSFEDFLRAGAEKAILKALTHPNRLTLLHVADLDRTVAQCWSGPLLRAAAGENFVLPIAGGLPWPENLRVTANLVDDAFRFEFPPSFVLHCAAVRRKKYGRSTTKGLSDREVREVPMTLWTSWIPTGEAEPLAGEFDSVPDEARRDVGRLRRGFLSMGLDEDKANRLAQRVRVDWPAEYLVTEEKADRV